jgi:maltose alpha-D-glucosyltransferase/alpha-amylase
VDLEYPEALLISEWSDPAVAIPAGFHIDSLLQFREPYRILLGPESRLDGNAREPHAFFERAGGGDIRAFIDEYLRHYNITKTRGYISIPTGNHDTPRPTQKPANLLFIMAMRLNEISSGVPNKEGTLRGKHRRSPAPVPSSDAAVEGKNAGFSIASREALPSIDPSKPRPMS